jgi:amino acid transporter
VLNLFYWFSGLSVIAIVFVEILVSVAVIAYFRRTGEDRRVWHTIVAPALAAVGLLIGLYLLVSRFGLLAGTVAEGSDPTAQTFALSTTGWVLVAAPFVAFAVGVIVGVRRRSRDDDAALRDLIS